MTKRLKIMELNNDLTRLCPIYVHTDAAQAIGKIAVDVDELGVDYLTIVGHKVSRKENLTTWKTN